MSPETNDNAVCPKCGLKLIYIEHYQSYYCSGCDEHFELEKSKGKTQKEVKSHEPIQSTTPGVLETQYADETPPESESEEVLPPPPPGYRKIQPPEHTQISQTELSTAPQPEYEEPQEPEYEEPQDPAYEESQEPEYEESQVPDNQEIQSEEYAPQQSDYEENISEDYQEEGYEGTPSETQKEEYMSELDSQEQIDHDLEELTLLSQMDSPVKKPKKKFKNYRYRTRMIKGSILPILFGVISFQMINSSRLQFPDYYELEAMMILMGFLLGFSIVSGITLVNLVKAKKNSKSGYQLSMKVGVVAYLPFLVIFLALTLFVSLSTGWKFATGFFLASIFPFLIVTMFEASSKGKFFVKEMVDDPSWGRKLVFKQ